MNGEKRENSFFSVLQRVGRSFMLPIALLPIAGLLLGIGSSFSNPQTIEAYNLSGLLGEGTFLNSVFLVMANTGNIVFKNLPLLFAMGVALGMAKKEKETAVLAAAIGFIVMHQTISTLLEINGKLNGESLPEGAVSDVLGIRSLEMGVFGGILVGILTAVLHNRFYKIKLPTVLSFFGGTRFVPIVVAVTFIVVGIIMYIIWPPIQTGISALGGFVLNSGYIGTFIYGVIERALIPFGLHHVFYLPFWQTGLGGSMMVDGQMISGAQNIFFAQLGSAGVTKFSVEATRFMSGKFPLMIFGLPGAALAMYTTAKSSRKKIVSGLLLSAALTSVLTGITEPLEFTFLFVAPVLYVIHCVFAGLAYMLMHVFNVGVGMTFSGGVIDLTLFGILQGNAKTNWIYVVLVGVVYFIVYYFLFRLLILKFDFATPGREGEGEESKLYTRADVDERRRKNNESAKEKDSNHTSALIIDGLGGRDNISDIDCCATRLRVTVKDKELVKNDVLRESGASGVIVKGNGVQVIYGPRVTVIKSELEGYMEGL